MSEDIKEYFDELIERYGDEVCLVARNNGESNLQKVPVALQSLYQYIAKASFPFGEILDVDEALILSKSKPFAGKWFVFGKDNYFSFWLCSYDVSEEGFSFTYWDHESGSDIGEPGWSDIVSCFRDIEEGYQELMQSLVE